MGSLEVFMRGQHLDSTALKPADGVSWDAQGLMGILRVAALRVVIKDSYAFICPRNFRVFLVLKGDTHWPMSLSG